MKTTSPLSVSETSKYLQDMGLKVAALQFEYYLDERAGTEEFAIETATKIVELLADVYSRGGHDVIGMLQYTQDNPNADKGYRE